jgi:predicted site-specific integrase-resolvase
LRSLNRDRGMKKLLSSWKRRDLNANMMKMKMMKLKKSEVEVGEEIIGSWMNQRMKRMMKLREMMIINMGTQVILN